MKTLYRKCLAALCALALLSSIGAPALAYSYALGEELRQSDTEIHQETQLSTNVFWSTVYNDFRTENFLTYKPNNQVRPIITYGSVLTETSTLTSSVRQLEAQGYRVVGGINGDFYNTTNGLPVGLIVTEGQLRSSDAGYYAMGFKKDGTAVMGKPGLRISADFNYVIYDDTGYGTLVRRDIAAVNKARVSTGGIYLFTYDFNRSHTTGNSERGIDAVCTIVSGSLAIGSSVRLRVDQVLETAAMTPIGRNQVVLSVNLRADEYWRKALTNLPVGTEFTVSVSSANSAWNDVEYGLGAMYLLAENGRIASGLPDGRSPRTAIGQRPDGTLIFYTIDGRQPGMSIGATMSQTAERLLELGCRTVLGLDGGGSTTISVTMPDASRASTINSPSEGAERAVSNKIFLIASGASTGVLDHFYLRPDNAWVLAGSRIHFAVSAVDTNYYPMNTPQGWNLSASAGTIDGATLTTPQGGGDITVTASGGGKQGKTVVHAVKTPDGISILDGAGNAASSLVLSPGDTAQFSASVTYQHMNLYADPEAYRWSVSDGIGNLSETGLFTAVTPGSGRITVTAGGKSASIPVTVSRVGLREMEDFEEPLLGTGTAELNRAVGGEEARYGRASGELRYAPSGESAWRYAQPIPMPGVPYDSLTIWIMGDGSGNQFSLLVRDTAGNERSIPAAVLNFTGWRQVTVELGGMGYSLAGYAVTAVNVPRDPDIWNPPSGEQGGPVDNPPVIPDTPNVPSTPSVPDSGTDFFSELESGGGGTTGIGEERPVEVPQPEIGMWEDFDIFAEMEKTANTSAIRPDTTVDLLTNREAVLAPASYGTLYLDQVVATYQGLTDAAPPTVTVSLSGRVVSASVRDNVDGILPAASVTAAVNGLRVNASYNAATGSLSCTLPEAGYSQEPTRITVTAQDASGNIGRASVDIAPYNTYNNFTDIDGCWAADYINFLWNQGIANPYDDGSYHPYDIITRVEFAVMLARASGLDGRDYLNVDLPYADMAEIPVSAIPSLRALYAENIMRGTQGTDGRLYLRPNSGLTRAQASAMIGRSQKLGYGSVSTLPFPDANTIPDYAVSHIRTMVARGILSGYEDGTFRPGANISRGQMAKILYYLA